MRRDVLQLANLRFHAALSWQMFLVALIPLACGQESSHQDDRALDVAVNLPLLLDHVRSPLMRTDLQISGATSCASASCHGGGHPGIARATARRGAEYPLWKEHDPHARAWQTICSPQSLKMLQRLKIMDQDRIVDQAGFDNCLGCHNTTRRFDESRSLTQLSEGVGCAACHGPDQCWIASHYQLTFDPRAATHVGFVDQRDPLTRARVCASCHVGDQDRDMNHDLIAAGHPALRFEFATYHARQPKHWRDEEDLECQDEAQLWLVGQMASLDASLTLLQRRAAQEQGPSSWPEFSEYECWSCHRDLQVRDELAPSSSPKSMAGRSPFASWNRAGLEWLLDYARDCGETDASDHNLRSALEDLQRKMETSARPDRVAVARSALEARRALDQWIRGLGGNRELAGLDAGRLKALADHAEQDSATDPSWDVAAQLYLARVAARAALPETNQADSLSALRQDREFLRFPINRDGPGPDWKRAWKSQVLESIPSGSISFELD